MNANDFKAYDEACLEHLKSGGDAISEAAFRSGWEKAMAHFKPIIMGLESNTASQKQTHDALLKKALMLDDMTLRDYFAGQVLQGEIACQGNDGTWENADGLVRRCYRFADAMLAEREKANG